MENRLTCKSSCSGLPPVVWPPLVAASHTQAKWRLNPPCLTFPTSGNLPPRRNPHRGGLGKTTLAAFEAAAQECLLMMANAVRHVFSNQNCGLRRE